MWLYSITVLSFSVSLKAVYDFNWTLVRLILQLQIWCSKQVFKKQNCKWGESIKFKEIKRKTILTRICKQLNGIFLFVYLSSTYLVRCIDIKTSINQTFNEFCVPFPCSSMKCSFTILKIKAYNRVDIVVNESENKLC